MAYVSANEKAVSLNLHRYNEVVAALRSLMPGLTVAELRG
jgi:hypothetical protein